MSEQKPSIGRIVHYVSHGTPLKPDESQAYHPACRAAIVTSVPDMTDAPDIPPHADLCVLNLTGMFFNGGVPQDETAELGGTWHWPERV